jgi:VCBS repeat-containing protein
MSRRTRTRLARPLCLVPLEPRTVPTTFEILSLGATGSATVQHDAVTGADYGGIAASASQLFVTGQTATGRFNLADLSGGTGVGAQYQGIVGDLHSQKVFVLGNAQTPLTIPQPFPPFGLFFSQLLEVNPATGALTGNVVNLSESVPVTSDTGIFAGYDRILIHPHSTFGPNPVYQVDTTTGTVTQLQNGFDVPIPQHHTSAFGWAYYGTAEHFGGNDYLDYVQDTSIIARELVGSAGSVTAISTPGITSLADMSSFTVSPSTGRWYFHHTGSSQFVSAPPGTQIAGYAAASFQVGDFVVTNTNDSGTGSLRDVIAQANATDVPQVIGFQTGLTGTINLSTPVNVIQSVDIEGPGSALISVSGASNLFNPSAGVGLTVHGLTLTGTAAAGLTVGYPLTASGDVIITGANLSVTAPLTTAGSVALNAGTGDVTFTNALSVQFGTLTLTDGNGVDLGPTSTVDGTLAAASGFNLAAGNVLNGTGVVSGNVSDAGTLGGTLTVFGNVTVKSGGTVSPGPFVATLMVNGNVTFQSGGTFTADIDGNQFADQIAVTGTVDLGTGNMLNPVFGFPPTPGDDYVLINNEGANPLSGLLNGVRNRSGEKIGSTYFQVRYDGGDGNDLELVANNSPVLDTSISVKLDPLTENVPPNSNPGTTVEALVATNNLYSDAQGLFRSGLAFTGFDSANGSWQYSRDGGTTWTSFGTLSKSSATLLEADGAGKNRVRFLPGRYFFGTATITFKAWDTTDGLADGTTGADTGTGGNNSPYSSDSVSATVQVLAVNQPPTPANDAYTTAEDTTLPVPVASGVLANDTDVDGPFPLTAAVVSGPAHGTLTLNADGSFTYTPAANFNGTDSFTYKAIDGDGAYGVAVATITVTPVNDPPTVVNDTVSVPEDGGAVVLDLLTNDSDAPDTGETLTITAVTQPAHGTVAIIDNGTKVTYTPNLHYFGPDDFTYTVTDNGTTNGQPDPKSATGSVAVTVTFVNHPPVANPDTASVGEDAGAQAIDVLANDTDVDTGDTRTVTGVSQALHGTVTIGPNGSNVLYTPDAEYYGPDQFLYAITDSHGGTSSSIVTVNVASNLDDRLEVDTTPGLTKFTEGQLAVPIDPGIQVGTAVDGIVTGATVRITAGSVATKDLLTFPVAGFTTAAGTPIKGKYSAASFALTLTGIGTPADYQAALRLVGYWNKSPAPVDGIRQVAFQLRDAAGLGPAGSKSVQVIGINTHPVLSYPATLAPVKFKLGKPAVAVAGPLSIKDVDNTRLQGATVSITANGQLPDALTINGLQSGFASGIRFAFANGTLTLTGNATIATYLKVLKLVKFSTTAGAGLTRTLSFQVTDGEPQDPLSNIVTRQVTVS